jgi:hypothetical protein
LKLDGHITESRISGNYRTFRADGKINGAVIENKDYVDGVESLVQDLQNWCRKAGSCSHMQSEKQFVGFYTD